MRKLDLISGAAALGLLGALAAGATPAAAADDGDALPGWHVAVTPYLWAAGMGGTVQTGPIGPLPPGEHSFHSSFGNSLSHLSFAFEGALDVRHDRFGLLTDVSYFDLNENVSGQADLVSVRAKVNPKMVSATIAGYYRVWSGEGGSVDILAGARINSLDLSVDVTSSIGPIDRTASRGFDSTLVDAVVGVRGVARLSPRWSLNGYVDVGGADRSTVWQILGGARYRFSEHWSAVFGYRYSDTRVNEARARIDLRMAGPYLGATYRF